MPSVPVWLQYLLYESDICGGRRRAGGASEQQRARVCACVEEPRATGLWPLRNIDVPV